MDGRGTSGDATRPVDRSGGARGDCEGTGSGPVGPQAVSLPGADQVRRTPGGLGLGRPDGRAWRPGHDDLPPPPYPEAPRDGAPAVGAARGEAGDGRFWARGLVGGP